VGGCSTPDVLLPVKREVGGVLMKAVAEEVGERGVLDRSAEVVVGEAVEQDIDLTPLPDAQTLVVLGVEVVVEDDDLGPTQVEAIAVRLRPSSA
jgi:hypothetical protein